ncbi:hypothetical protein [Streptomyces sp. NBC_00268]|uniref:hypothetical protein n=1 Tax=Streptomyces sp. NBC_00268 TaxID=2975695 RepID=UPI0022516095|nr:hypothetical protein [Streptomyces sp. NBC_00268]MCX5187579.1 hypothetical protein [Streptomyces sp. NBC_00268]
MFVYHLNNPIDLEADDGDSFVPLTHWLTDNVRPEKAAWLLETTLALADAAPAVRWDGDMRHLPFVDAHGEDTTGEPALIVIQQEPVADSFVISRRPVSWAQRQSDRWHETRTRDIAPTVFTAQEPNPINPLTPTPF